MDCGLGIEERGEGRRDCGLWIADWGLKKEERGEEIADCGLRIGD